MKKIYIYIAHDVYNAEKYMAGNFFFNLEVWEKNLTQTKSPILPSPIKVNNWLTKNHIRDGRRSGFDTLVTVIHQQNGWRAFMMWWCFKTKVLYFKVENSQRKTPVERESLKKWSV